jgi:hypothetical protein
MRDAEGITISGAPVGAGTEGASSGGDWPAGAVPVRFPAKDGGRQWPTLTNRSFCIWGWKDLHEELGGKMVPFAGYLMPVQYPTGVLKEHLHTRAAAGLFDVSHMGQVILRPRAAWTR